MNTLKFLFSGLLVASSMLASPAQAQAQGGQAKPPLKIIIPYGPGGVADGFSRLMGQEFLDKTGRAVVVENRTGGQSVPAVSALMSAPPDGNTLAIFGTEAVAVNQFLFAKPLYDPEKMEPVAMIASIPLGMVVRADFPASNLAEFVAYVKKNPGIPFASPGAGTPIHLMMEQFRQVAGLKDMTHVPYKGSVPAIQDMLAGQISLGMLDPSLTQQYIKAGKLKMLAIATKKRISALPDVPTFEEAGYPNFVGVGWYVAYLPLNTPKATVDQMSAQLKSAIESPALTKWFADMLLTPTYLPPAETKAEVKREAEKFSKLVKSLGLRLDN